MYKMIGKRIFDIFFSIIGVVILGIVLIPISILIYIQDRGSIFYNSNRLGKDGKVFKMYKLRSMKVNAPDIRNNDGSTFNSENDPRLTKIGKFIRKTSIDELPQFINVLKGEMSLIGPRPDLPEQKNMYTGNEIRRLEVNPGITGYSQAYFRNSINWKERIQKDIYYVDNLSFKFDLNIFFRTIFTVLKSQGVYSVASKKDSEDKMKESNKRFLCKELSWDTNYFGVKCGRLDLLDTIDTTDKKVIEEFVKKCEFVVITNVKERPLNNQYVATELKGFLTDVNVKFRKTNFVDKFNGELNENISVQNNYDYNEKIVELANKVFVNSRFLNDNNISKQQADELYNSWVISSFNKENKYFMTYILEGNIVGFWLFSTAEKKITGELLSVSKDHGRKGIGKELMKNFETFALKNGYEEIEFGTQVENIKAINLYEKAGYEIVDISYIYHLWNK